jgi:adenylate cyclase
VFFSDIADFTATTQDLQSEELTSLLNEYLTEMSEIALGHGATIDKYIGDAILAFFGDPETKGARADAIACVSMAVEMQRRMSTLEAAWRDRGIEKPFRLRIGISTGYCTVGNFGSPDRMDYTIIGSDVNLASRLQAHAVPGSILLSHETRALVKDKFKSHEQEPILAKGIGRPVRNYKVIMEVPNVVPSGETIAENVQLLSDILRVNPVVAAKLLRLALNSELDIEGLVKG